MSDKPVEGELVTTENLTKLTESGAYKLTPRVLELLQQAFHNSYSVTEACQLAKISRETYYDWLRTIDGFEAQMEEAKAVPLRKAKEVITGALQENDINTAKWYVERRDPAFKSKGELDVNHGLQQTKEKIRGFLDDTDDLDSAESDADSAKPPAPPTVESGAEVAEPPTDIS